MTTLRKTFYNSFFSHIYIEKEALNYPITKTILAHYPNAAIVMIDHYKDVFNRRQQNYREQKNTPSLILAVNPTTGIYEGSAACQNFGNDNFYYTSGVMNCIYDCEYCYLQGMYPSANMVVFVNLADSFHEILKLLKKQKVYLCISYDTDLLALESWLGYVKCWNEFAVSNKELTIECRTKSASVNQLKTLIPSNNFILAWTLSPPAVQKTYEHNTPSFSNRLTAIEKAIELGFTIRLCFDPLLRVPDWKKEYEEMFTAIFQRIPAKHILDVSLGCFRVPADFMKVMRKQNKESLVLNFPYTSEKGILSYRSEESEEILSYCLFLLTKWIKEDNIYVWKE
ncbi:SPL family radical SAM protein [Anaerocolumna sp. AGMB13020]|uniref:SPL family radical SAM protein n=1 Tax=Anaerocolumna sp. AGMB13020 TaxID=3081750 RepID=UPI002F3E9A90